MARGYSHGGSKRQSLPTADQGKRQPGLTATERKSMKPKDKANHETSLNWKRAVDLENLEVDVKTIFVHERILPEQLIVSIEKQTQEDAPLLAEMGWKNFNGIEPGTDWTFYQHANWQNRLIHGNSIEVMASLLDKEPTTLAGKVQCIYFDPPFGIDYDGFRRPPESGAKNRTGEQRTASYRGFVDSYVRVEPDGNVTTGLPAYLDGIYRTCTLARQLLTDSGSMFIQISNVNLHRVALIMDEVFGESNRMQIIKYQTGTTASKSLGRSGDYLLWYAKCRSEAEAAYNQLYVERSKKKYLAQLGSDAIGRHKLDARIRTWSQLIAKYGTVPKDWELGTKTNMKSQHPGKGLQSESWPRCEICPKGIKCDSHDACAWFFENKEKSKFRDSMPYTFRLRPSVASPDPSTQWRVNNPMGLDKLAITNRLCASVKRNGKNDGVRNVRELAGEIQADDNDSLDQVAGELRWVVMYSEDPGQEVVDSWESGLVPTQRKMFVVQTPEKFVERCILMTSKPGDLVLDPTCGSGTTAVVAERHGRRWITSDAGAWQISVARERLTTALFNEYLLKNSEEGKRRDVELDEKHGTSLSNEGKVNARMFEARDPAQGFVYDRRPKVSAGSLSRNQPFPSIRLVDRPEVAKEGKNRRVCSAFTVERLSPYQVVDGTQVTEPVSISTTSRRAEAKLEGFSIHDAEIEGIRDACPLEEGSMLTHRCIIGGNEAAMWIAQPSETVSEYQINKAVDQAENEGFTDLVVAAFGYEETSRPSKLREERLRVWCLILPVGLTVSDTEVEKSNPPVLLAEPVVSAEKIDDERITIVVEGFTTWNPQKPDMVAGDDTDEIACIMIDTNYDGLRFNARRIQFPKPPEKSLKSDPYRRALEYQVEQYRVYLDEMINKDAWKYVRSNRCVPFKPPGNGAVAVRIITSDGETMNRVIESNELKEMVEYSDD